MGVEPGALRDFMGGLGEPSREAGDGSREQRPPPPTLPPEVAQAALYPKNRFGKYVLLEKLGQGGFGAVFKAYDPSLGIYVALKQVTNLSDEALARFHSEAKTAARLKHDRIARIYEHGEADGRHYIAMEFVDGRELASTRLDEAEAIRLIRDASKAVHYAHQQGVVHRDLTPRNLMRTQDGKVMVVDFGLARPVVGAERLTAKGFVIGTPNYMSPEQAKGHEADCRSDVYMLGATLYQLVTGEPPFPKPRARPGPRRRRRDRHAPGDASPGETFRQVAEEEPTPPRMLKPRIRQDLQAIILKALEKEPSRRYGTAALLAADLTSYLKGDPVTATPAGLPRRIRRFARRHPTLTVAAIALAGLVAASVFFLAQTRLSARTRAQNLTLRAISEFEKGNLADADRLLAEALRIDPEQPEGNIWAGMVRLKAYSDSEKLPDLWKIGEWVAFDVADAHGTDRVRLAEEIRQHFAQYRRALVHRPLQLKVPESPEALLDGVEALFAGHANEAASFLEKSVSGDDPPTWLALLRAHAYYLAFRFDDGEKFVRERLPPAENWRNALLLCRMLQGKGIAATLTGGDPTGIYAEALNILDGLRRIPGIEVKEIPVLRAEILVSSAAYRQSRGGDPTEELDEAARTMTTNAPSMEDVVALGDVWLMKAEVARSSGTLDPEGPAEVNNAIEAYTSAIERSPESGRPLAKRGLAYRMLGDFFEDTGREDELRASYRAAIRDLEEAIRILPLHPELLVAVARARGAMQRKGVYEKPVVEESYRQEAEALRLASAGFSEYPRCANELAHALVEWGQYRQSVGESPIPQFEEADRVLALCVEVNPRYVDGFMTTSELYVVWGLFASERGEDPIPRFQRALRAIDAGLQVNPASASLFTSKGYALGNWATHLANSGDAEGFFRLSAEAIAAYDEAIRRNPRKFEAYTGRAIARFQLSGRADRFNVDGEDVQAALADLEEAIQLNPRWSQSIVHAAEAQHRLGMRLHESGSDPRNFYQTAISMFGRALEVNPASADAYIGRASTRLSLGTFIHKEGGDPRPILDQAIDDATQAISINPESWEAYHFRGGVHRWLGDYLKTRTGSALWSEELEEALKDYARAIEINPTIFICYYERGAVLTCLDRYQEAIADLDHALELNPAANEVSLFRGSAWGYLGFDLEDAGQDPTECFEHSLDDLRRASSALPWHWEANWFYAQQAEIFALWCRNHGRQPRAEALRDETLRQYGLLVERWPNRTEGWTERGQARLLWGDPEGALSDFEQALGLDPSLITEIADDLGKARQQVQERHPQAPPDQR